jgi:hypothetical protein
MDAVDAFAACFPPASVTGAPKIAAMEIIRTLEPVPPRYLLRRHRVLRRRRPGALERGDSHGDGGRREGLVPRRRRIVADSDPAANWAETIAKGTRLRQALA